MPRRDMSIDEIGIKVGIAVKAGWILIVAVSACFFWSGSINARTNKIEQEQSEVQKKVEIIQADTQYIRGRLDAKWGEKQ